MNKKYEYLFIITFIVIILFGLIPLLSQSKSIQFQIENSARVKQNIVIDNFKGLCYGPHRDNEDPDFGVQPTRSEMKEDLIFIENLTSSIRTYGAADGLEQIPILCDSLGIDCHPGAWISKLECENGRQIESLINLANQNLIHVKSLIVGNEVLLREDISEEKLIEYITTVKNETNLQVASAETWFDWKEHSDLANAVDIMFVHIYPYWDGIPIENSAAYVLEKWNELKVVYPGKTMVLGETGWPSEGDVRGNAIPGEENQKRYISDLISMADSNNIEYFYFEIFDEKWKTKFLEGETGAHWGMYYSDGSPKLHLLDLLPESARNGINRPPREVMPKSESLPLYIYHDGCDTLNKFFSSGWMGELEYIFERDSAYIDPGNQITITDIIYESSTNNPYSGESCIRITYKPSPNQWGGIYWQFPINNWGEYPGYNLSESFSHYDRVVLSFMARGENGGEKAEFKTGGIKNSSLPYQDSYGPISTGVQTLTTDWQLFSLDLTGKDLSNVMGGFVWVTNYLQNPDGSTIFLDDIKIEKSLLPVDSAHLDFGNLASGAIEQGINIDLLTFDAQSRDKVILQAKGSSSSFDPFIEVFNPNNELIISKYTENQQLRIDTLNMQIPGMYKAYVMDWGRNDTSPFNISIQCTNNPGNATTIAYDSPINASIDKISEMDTYTINLSSGDTLSIEMEASLSSFDPRIEVYDPDGALVYKKIKNNGILRLNYLIVEKAGQYTILAMDDGGDQTSDYTITLKKILDPVLPVHLEYNTTVSASINYLAEIDNYTFDANAGDIVILQMKGSNTFDSRLEVYDPQGNLIAANAINNALLRIDTLKISKSGRHTILAMEAQGDQTGDYNICIQRSFDPPNSTFIKYNTTASASIDNLAEMDAFTFDGKAGDIVIIQMKGSNTFDSKLEVYDPNGKRIASENINNSLLRIDTLKLSISGKQTILAMEAQGDQKGDYNICIQRSFDPPNSAFIEYNTTTSASIENLAEMDAFTFDGTAGDIVILQMKGGNTFDSRLEVYDPNGKRIALGFIDNSLLRIDTLKIPISGKQTILAMEAQGDQTGDYYVSLVLLYTNVDSDKKLLQKEYSLSQNYPNPFNPKTKIEYNLLKSSRTRILIYNIKGALVRKLVDLNQNAGKHSVIWDGCNNQGILLPSGIYFYQIKTSEFVNTKSMLLIK